MCNVQELKWLLFGAELVPFNGYGNGNGHGNGYGYSYGYGNGYGDGEPMRIHYET